MCSNDELEIGQARPDEADDVLRIMCEAFQMDVELAGPIYYSDPYFQVENKMVARLGGRIVSCLTIVDRECWIGAAVVRLAGIAGVATEMKYRRMGIAGQLLQATVVELARRGYHLSALYPRDREYYRRFGWETAGVQTYVRELISEREPVSMLSLRPVCESDIPALSGIYDRAAYGRTLHCTRDARRWRYLLEYIRDTCVALDANGQVVGYALYELRSAQQDRSSDIRSSAPPQIEASPRDLYSGDLNPNASASQPHSRRSIRLLEMYCERSDAVTALRHHLAELGSQLDFEYSATSSVLSRNGFTMTDAPVPGPMARVIDWNSLIAILSAGWPAPTHSVGLVWTDSLLQPPTRAALITGSAKGAEVEFAAPSDFPARCSRFLVGDVCGWSAVAVGHLSVREACRIGALKASNPEAIEAADPLFPARDPFIPTADHF